jgi:hypothetical protein
MIICVAAATKSMTTNKTTGEAFSRKELQDKIRFLPHEIVSFTDDLRANTLFSIISTADVILEFAWVSLRQKILIYRNGVETC